MKICWMTTLITVNRLGTQALEITPRYRWDIQDSIQTITQCNLWFPKTHMYLIKISSKEFSNPSNPDSLMAKIKWRLPSKPTTQIPIKLNQWFHKTFRSISIINSNHSKFIHNNNINIRVILNKVSNNKYHSKVWIYKCNRNWASDNKPSDNRAIRVKPHNH